MAMAKMALDREQKNELQLPNTLGKRLGDSLYEAPGSSKKKCPC
jgi:hypothetical protein